MFLKRLSAFVDTITQCHVTSGSVPVPYADACSHACALLWETQQKEGTIYLIGNGGSAGIASHICIDLLKTLSLSAATFYDSNVLTAIGNDCGYDQIFQLPLERVLRAQDLLIAISSSGRSPNILHGVRVAQERNASIMTLSGFHAENPLRQMGHLNFWLDRADYGIVEVGHLFLLHTMVDGYPEYRALCMQGSGSVCMKK